MTKTPAPVSNFIRKEVPILVAITVMFSGKQTTTRKMEDQQKNCINQRAHGFYSNRIYTPTNGRSYMLISGPNLPTISSCFKRLKGFLNLKLIKQPLPGFQIVVRNHQMVNLEVFFYLNAKKMVTLH